MYFDWRWALYVQLLPTSTQFPILAWIQVDMFKLVNEEGQDATTEINRTLAALDTMLSRMNDVLREMRRRETFNELVKRLQTILDRQAEIREQTNKARMRSLIEGQFDFGDSE